MSQSAHTNQPLTPPPNHHWRHVLFVFILLGLLGYQGWQYYEQQRWQRHIERLETELNTFKAYSQQGQQNQTAFQADLQQLTAQQQQLESSLTLLAQQIQQSQQPDEDWLLSETRHLITIAHHRLSLQQDAQGALLALETAQAQLQALKAPALLPLKKQLTQDITQLSQLKQPDIKQLATELDQYRTQADTLPLLQGRQSVTVAEKKTLPEIRGWQDSAEVIWQQLKQMVTVRYSTEADAGLLTPQQRRFVEHSLRLKFEIARFALLRYQAEEFAAAIQNVDAWLGQYYDQNDPTVKTLRVKLAEMPSVLLTPALPDVSATLTLLQNLTTSTGTPAL